MYLEQWRKIIFLTSLMLVFLLTPTYSSQAAPTTVDVKDATYISNLPELKGLSSWQIWKDPASNRLYRVLAGTVQQAQTIKAKLNQAAKQPANVTPVVINDNIGTHILNIEELRQTLPWKVWKDPNSNRYYRLQANTIQEARKIKDKLEAGAYIIQKIDPIASPTNQPGTASPAQSPIAKSNPITTPTPTTKPLTTTPTKTTVPVAAKPSANKQTAAPAKSIAPTPTPDSACDNKWRTALIILNKEGDTVPESIKNKAEAVRRDFPAYFYEATSKLGIMDTSDTVYILNIPNEMIDYQQGNVYFSKVTEKFYQNYPDNFDFLAFYTVFPSTGEFYFPVVGNITGIGKSMSDQSSLYKSNHKLKGITFFNNALSKFDYNKTNGKENIINGLLHEIGHHWCCSIGDNFAKGENNAQLEIKQQGIHFYRGLQSPTAAGDPMDSDNWVSNNNGTYRRQNEPGINVYHPFQLYFMGLLPTTEYSVKHVLYNAGIVGQDFHPENATFYKEINVNDIIAVEGQRTCKEL